MLRRLLIFGSDRKRGLAFASPLPEGEFLVRVETSAVAALQAAKGWQPDCVVLRVGGQDGETLELCRGIKGEHATSRIPVMLVSADRDQRLVNGGFESGADDFMVEPCHPTELLWRLRGLIRRYEAPSAALQAVEVGPFELNAEQGTARLEGRALELTKKEFLILELFLRHADRLLSRRYVLDNVWGFDSAVRTRVVDLCVFQLRGKLGARWGSCLRTRRGFGYILEIGGES
ncbi:MAG: response regulator transcription factor [Elusimicrobia bacterium]|nr:response regulator transcription factor [Elusimicrobiota bacterium]